MSILELPWRECSPDNSSHILGINRVLSQLVSSSELPDAGPNQHQADSEEALPSDFSNHCETITTDCSQLLRPQFLHNLALTVQQANRPISSIFRFRE